MADWIDEELQDIDRLLRGLSLDPEDCRTDGGRLRVSYILEILNDRRTTPPEVHEIKSVADDIDATSWSACDQPTAQKLSERLRALVPTKLMHFEPLGYLFRNHVFYLLDLSPEKPERLGARIVYGWKYPEPQFIGMDLAQGPDSTVTT